MKYNPALDGIRAIAIILVLIAHLDIQVLNPYNNLYIESMLCKLGLFGTSGVDLFFILSGFLITSILLNTKSQRKIIYYKNFYAKRILRIFPLYYAVLIFVLLILPKLITYDLAANRILNHQEYLWLYLSNLCRTGLVNVGWDNSSLFHMGHFWSLAVEEQFYILWPTFVLFCTTKQLKIASLFLLTLSVLSGIISDCYFINISKDEIFINWSTITRGGALILGALLAIKNIDGHPMIFSKINKVSFGVFIMLYILLMIIPRSILPIGNHLQYYLSWGVYYLFIKFILSIPNIKDNKLMFFLENKYLVKIGTISYGLYIFNGLLRPLITKMFYNLSTGVYFFDILIYCVLYVGITYLISIISYKYYEKPFLKLKRFFNN